VESDTYPIPLADSAGVVDVAGPREAERSSVEVAVRKHVRQTERVVVVLRQQLQERLDAVVTGEPSDNAQITSRKLISARTAQTSTEARSVATTGNETGYIHSVVRCRHRH